MGRSFYWAGATVLGLGEGGFVTGPFGWAVGWLLGLFGVAIVATITGALVGFVIDFLLKEGQGMGAAGYRDHIVVCGWNATARDLIAELGKDEYGTKVVLLHEVERSPAPETSTSSGGASAPRVTCVEQGSKVRRRRSCALSTDQTRRT